MKKILSLSLVGLFVLTLAGCVNIEAPEEEVDCELYPTHVDCIVVDPNSDEAPGIIDVLDTFPTEDITITFWHTYGQNKEALLLKYIADFNELHPNVTIEAASQGGYDELRDKMILAISSGETPTMVVGYPDHVAGYLNGDAVIPLDDFIKSDEWGIDLTDFITSYVAENNQYEGGLMYSLPYSKSTEMVTFNKDLFEANGITIPTDRALTFTELEAYADVMVGTGANQCEYLINYDASDNLFINNVRMWDGGYTNNAGEILVDNTNTISMLNTMQDYFEDHTVAIPIAWNQSYGTTNFGEGDVCMTVGSTAGVSYNVAAAAGKFEVGFAPIPQWDEDHLSAVQQGPNIMIMSETTDAERLVSWEFIKYITGSEQTAQWSMLTGYLPVRYSGYESLEYQYFLSVPFIDNASIETLIASYVDDSTTDASIEAFVAYYEANKVDLKAKYETIIGETLTEKQVMKQVYDTMYTNRYEALAANAAFLQIDYQEYDPAFADRTTSSAARLQAEIVMNAVFVGNVTIEEAIEDMLYQLGVE